MKSLSTLLFTPLRFGLPLIASFGIGFQALATSIQVIDINGKKAAGLVVYANVSPTPANTFSAQQTFITQQDKTFVPAIAVAQKDQFVTFQNKDDITHHIYSVSQNNGFSFKIKAEVNDKTHQFTHVGQVSMGCNIHDWMSGYLYVVDTPYFGITDKNGMVTLAIPPSATAVSLMVWHPNLAKGEALTFSVEDPKAPAMQLTLKASYTPFEVAKPQTDFDFLDDYE